ncbi:hypothetical protein AHMF7605_16570 [Adhaeribacter arboris]|uniref:Uncharacterized protein n=1 Tax=Adhaeribacter arboris TaxID=2072846 RepID=A0A2T2YHL7_9BACT|nr:hypothetical protein [Adhaeribacter arboris]PSR55003.1 hypothetical protein AHMF7605_16570 [Adhaeribacter arboris]
MAFHNFKEEPELEAGLTNTINAYAKEQVASLTAYKYIINAVNYTKLLGKYLTTIRYNTCQIKLNSEANTIVRTKGI